MSSNPFANDIDIFKIRCHITRENNTFKAVYHDFHLKSFNTAKIKNVNTRFNAVVKLNYTSSAKTKAHLRYLQREGAGIDGEKATLFTEDRTFKNGKSYLKENFLKNEKTIFKVVISPEKKDIDLESFTRRVMQEVSKSQGQKLNYIAAIHDNTANPHVHVVIRGIDKDDQNVRLKKKLIKTGIREIAKDDIAINYGEKTFYQAKSDELKRNKSFNVNNTDRIIDRNIKKLKPQNGYVSYIPQNDIQYERLLHLSKLGLTHKTFIQGKDFMQKGFKVKTNFLKSLTINQQTKDLTKSFYKNTKKGDVVL